MHDRGVAALATDLASRTAWRVHAEVPGFEPPAPRAGRIPDVVCERGTIEPPVVFEVELPETLVRRDTVRRLATLVERAFETRLVMISEDDHDETIRDAARLLKCAGIDIPVAAIAPQSETLTGADW